MKTGMAILLLGAVCAAQDDAEKRYHERRTELKVERAKVDLVFAEVLDRRARSRFESGTVSSADVIAAGRRVVRARGEMRLAALEHMEVKRTGRAPGRQITAPLAGRFDFVLEALKIERETLGRIADLAKRERREAETLNKNGLMPEGRLDAIRLADELARLRLGLADKLLALRDGFGDKPAGRVMAGEKKARAQNTLDEVAARAGHAARRYQRVAANLRNGAATQADLLAARHDFDALRVDKKLAELDLARAG